MKKFTFFPGSALLILVVGLLFLSCQKEQSSVTDETAKVASSESNNIVGVAGTTSWAGSIDPAYAASLAANYLKKYGEDDNQTQSVAFSAKDLIAYIANLQNKYKSDIVYVNFGVYGQGAKPVNAKDWGRLTVFFTGNKIPAPNSVIKNDGTSDTAPDGFLNHGQLTP